VKTRLTIAAMIVTLTGISALAMYARRGTGDPEVSTEPVSRGSIVNTVSASGTLEAVTTVQVGTQVSGTIMTLEADFNSIVKKGQVLARLDPSLFQSDVQEARANLIRAEAETERLRVALSDADTKLGRARELSAKQLIPATELDAAEVARRLADAQVRSAAAQVSQARAALSQAEVNLKKTVIASPIDGIVISRNVDVGQTVAASLQAPTVFVIAADLAGMQVKASVDESDLGSVKAGQSVTFRVDAYPNSVFRGAVEEVRLNPVVVQNVVTYDAIISAPNKELKLRPGMTATVTVEVARRDNVLRVPNAALRFKPTDEVLAALGGTPARSAKAPVVTKPTGTSGRTAGDNKEGTVWLYDGGLHPARVTLGVSDASYTEVVGDAVHEGATLATRVALPGSSGGAPATTVRSPLMGSAPRR
jgi:HlyD family secretion protein